MDSNCKIKVAVLYQAKSTLFSDADSGADIAYNLKTQQIPVITPATTPAVSNDLDWVFPDTEEGMHKAIAQGADTFWLNTDLYAGHPVESFIHKGISVVGQYPPSVELYDNKWFTNHLLRKNGLPVADSFVITTNDLENLSINFPFPVVVKPVRRGVSTEGVQYAADQATLEWLLAAYDAPVYVEAYLPGQEISITVLPPGEYTFSSRKKFKQHHWCLPAVKKVNGVSELLNDEESDAAAMQVLYRNCEAAAKLVGARAPVRMDCRADENGRFFIIDLHMRPLMRGVSRPHRPVQDSLSALSARKVRWDYTDLLVNLLTQRWRMA